MPLWLWPNVLSLDAPLVAVLWQVLFARCFHAPVAPIPAVLLASSVWLIYSADRILDSRRDERWTPRHQFYRCNWRKLAWIWIFVLACSGWLAIAFLPRDLFRNGLALLSAVIIYFAVVHFATMRIRRFWPKEAAVGVVFALGASLAAWSEIHGVTDAATILLFSCLCWINCVAIEKWETKLDWPVGSAAIGVAASALLLFYLHRPVLGAAEMASAFGFVLLDRIRWRFSLEAVRVLADVALLSPIFLLPVAGNF